MKKIFTILALIMYLGVAAQKSEIITDSSKAKLELFNKSISWVVKTWGDADKVITLKDTATGTISVKGGLKSAPKLDGYPVKGLTVTELTILVKAGEAKINFTRTNFNWEAGTVWNFEDNNGGAQKEKWKADVLQEMDEMIAAYKAEYGK